MIDKVHICNFKALVDVEVELERFTLFVGPNSSGKSSILQALDLVSRSFQYGPRSGIGEYRSSRNIKSRRNVEVKAYRKESIYRYTDDEISKQGDSIIYGNACCNIVANQNWQQWERADEKLFPPLAIAKLLRFELSSLKAIADDATTIDESGIGLHNTTAKMNLSDPDAWKSLQENVRKIVPGIRRLRHTGTMPSSLLFDMTSGEGLTADQVSEGTLLVVGLLAVMSSTDHPNLLLLDDLDRGLHPKAQRELIALLRSLLETHPKLQILATTHSPYIVNSMKPEEVRMTFQADDGTVACGKLTDHPKYDRWKNEFAPGELWSMFGEKWVLEKAATK
jgi:predicted ATPase